MAVNLSILRIIPSKSAQYVTLALLIATGILAAESGFSPGQAAQQFSCTGQMQNGWGYTAEFLDGRFTQIRWNRSGQPPQVSSLTFSSTNSLGEPVYRGAFQGATAVTLIDLSKGDVRSGSQISVGVEEWGWSRGNCGTSGSGSGSSGPNMPAATVRQNLLGVEQTQAREWLRQNGFFFSQTMEHTDTRVIERWNRDMSRAIDVSIVNTVVADVVEAR